MIPMIGADSQCKTCLDLFFYLQPYDLLRTQAEHCLGTANDNTIELLHQNLPSLLRAIDCADPIDSFCPLYSGSFSRMP
jgi:hypothetical protein